MHSDTKKRRGCLSFLCVAFSFLPAGKHFSSSRSLVSAGEVINVMDECVEESGKMGKEGSLSAVQESLAEESSRVQKLADDIRARLNLTKSELDPSGSEVESWELEMAGGQGDNTDEEEEGEGETGKVEDPYACQKCKSCAEFQPGPKKGMCHACQCDVLYHIANAADEEEDEPEENYLCEFADDF